jgi:hypothetical protein
MAYSKLEKKARNGVQKKVKKKKRTPFKEFVMK